MKLQESGEMYLETIYILSREMSQVRSIDICAHLGYSKPSVSRAVKLLREEGYIKVAGDGTITLTKTGEDIAATIYERHTVFTRMLVNLGVSQDTAEQDACRMEHAVSDESFQAIKRHLNSNH